MDFMDIPQEIAEQVILDEINIHRVLRFRFTARLRAQRRSEAEEAECKETQNNLEMTERKILAYEDQLAEIRGNDGSK